MTSERRRVRKVRRGGYLACLLALSLLHRYPTLALPQAPAAAATGHISGHIYRADTGAPLANVTVTAQQNSGSARYWTGKSGADGNYVIEGLPADGLWIGAYREGFVGMFYGNYNGSPAIKLLQPGSAASGVDIRLPVQPKITKITV